MGLLREIFRKGPSEKDLAWQKAREVMRGAGGMAVMLKLATELREQGDSSAMVTYTKWNHNMDTLVLWWEARPLKDIFGSTYWMSKAVRVNASHTGEVSVDFMLGGWHGMENVKDWDDPYRTQFGTFLSEERSLEEKVRFAMGFVGRDSGYCYGGGSISRRGVLRQSKIEQVVF